MKLFESKLMAHTSFPPDLPVPQDDGLCDHVLDSPLPNLSLPSTSDPPDGVNLTQLQGLTIIFCYPRTAAPNEVVPASWDAIPSARGCTPQACSFRDNLPLLKEHGVKRLYGLSTQSPEYQKEVHERLHLPYDLLSDEKLELVQKMGLPTIEWEGKQLVRRITLALEEGRVVKCWYPVFPPDRNAADVLEWLKER